MLSSAKIETMLMLLNFTVHCPLSRFLNSHYGWFNMFNFLSLLVHPFHEHFGIQLWNLTQLKVMTLSKIKILSRLLPGHETSLVVKGVKWSEFWGMFFRPGFLMKRHPQTEFDDSDRTQVVVPREFRDCVLSLAPVCLFAAHLGRTKTYKLVRSDYFWPGMYSDSGQSVLVNDNVHWYEVPGSYPIA